MLEKELNSIYTIYKIKFEWQPKGHNKIILQRKLFKNPPVVSLSLEVSCNTHSSHIKTNAGHPTIVILEISLRSIISFIVSLSRILQIEAEITVDKNQIKLPELELSNFFYSINGYVVIISLTPDISQV